MTISASAAPAPPLEIHDAPARFGRAALGVVSIAVALVVSQQLMLSVSLPQVTADLGATPTELAWILDSYPICLAALLLTGGALGDRYGRRRMLLIGLVLMAVTDLGAALTHSPNGMITARVGCALGAALVFPATLSTLTTALGADQRSRAVAVWSISAILGAFGGIFAVGFLLEFFTWRAACWGSAGLAALLIPAVAAFVPESAIPEEAVLDAPSMLTAGLGVGATTYAIITAGEHGLLDLRVLLGLVVGLTLCMAFVRRQWLAPRPMLNVRAFTDPIVAIGLVGMTGLFFIIYATAFLAVQYLSIVHGQSALQIGTTLLTFGIPLVPLTFASARWAKRTGPGPLVIVGLIVVAGSDVGLSRMNVNDSLLIYLGYAIVFGAGVGLMQAPATECIVAALPAAEQGLASALNDITRELGAALGIAISSAVLTANLGTGPDPRRVFMAAWGPACLTLAVAAVLTACLVALLHRRAPRPDRRHGRHAAGRTTRAHQFP